MVDLIRVKPTADLNGSLLIYQKLTPLVTIQYLSKSAPIRYKPKYPSKNIFMNLFFFVESLGGIFDSDGVVGLFGILSRIGTNRLFLWHLYQW